jgi:hypothetical protein
LPEHITEWARLIGLETVVGFSVGGVIGMFAAIARKRAFASVWLDALLGAIGFVGGAVTMALVPWHHTTTTENKGGMIISTTTMHYPNPYRVAFAAAIILPVLCEMVRSWIAKRKPSS